MLNANEELRMCADAHEEEVITKDSYHLKVLAEKDKDIKYIVDIGANLGAFSNHCMTLFPEAKIIVCEAEPMLMKYAKENTQDKLIYVNKAAVGNDDVKEVNFNVCKWQGNHHVEGTFRMDIYGVPEVGSEILHSITVPAITLQQMIDDNNFPKIDLLKIDTEGSEPAILSSIKPWIKNIKYIVAEWHSQDDLKIIKEVLQDTHNAEYLDGFFKEPKTGLPANGSIFAELK